jgi:glycerophosphoryl diester phosphodiesterase
VDEGLNGSLTYRISNENPLFEVDEQTGEITLKQQLQWHLQAKYLFVLEATDRVCFFISFELEILKRVKELVMVKNIKLNNTIGYL